MKKLNLAVVGCGNISDIYLKNLTTKFDNINVYAIADLIEDNAKRMALTYKIDRIMSLDEILLDERIDVVLNITTPKSHYEICKKILESGKHVYVEKPLTLSYDEGLELIDYATKHNLYVGCAPDTVLGAGISTCKKLISDGVIGKVIGATAFMVCHGHEHWHPNPEFYYKKGGGPMYDMGPYYLTALTEMIGNAIEVSGMTGIGNDFRTITSTPKNGKKIKVDIPTHVNGLIRFENGAIANIITSFDVWGSTLPCIEIYGTLGSIICPDPNTFGGVVKCKIGRDEFKEIPLINAMSDNLRGLGLSEMVNAIINNDQGFTASGKRALHVLEIMEKIHISNDICKTIKIESRF